jgi:leucyl aminopeptidase
MPIRAVFEAPESTVADWLALGVPESEQGPIEALGATPARDLFADLLQGGDLPTGMGETAPVFGASGLRTRKILAFGLGPKERLDAGVAYAAGVAVARKLASKPRDVVAVVLPDGADTVAKVSALVEGLVVGQRGPDLRKSEPARHEFRELRLVAPAGHLLSTPHVERAVSRGTVVGQAVNLARDLVNMPPADKAPRALAERAREIGNVSGLEVTIRDAAWLRAERFGGVLGVAAGSDEPPAFVKVEYQGGGDRPTLALVGKGVTFDSGGLSLKPSSSMEDMKCDMTGAAVVLATMVAVAKLGLSVNVSASFALVENMTGGRAMKLGDVLTHRNGKTVEVMNTDAEGRLVLADVLSYVVERAPAAVIDLATLTGACMVALGNKVAGLFANQDALAERVLAACKATGERAWRLPLDDDYRELLKSPIADLKNVGGKWGGAITAAKFLEQFVGQVPWVHLDIAGPSWAESESPTRDAGATGCFVRTLVALLETGAP